MNKDLTWIKLYRKAKDNQIMSDPVAWTIFCWILMTVDRRTGEMTLGRKWASKILGLKEGTFYKGLKRLEKKYKNVVLVTEKVTIKYTRVRVLNWDKYQSKNEPVTDLVTIKEQSSNNPVTHNKNIENIRIKNNIYTGIASPENLKKEELLKYKDQKSRHLDFQSLSEIFISNTHVTTQAQEEALRIAEQLGINLDTDEIKKDSLRARWFSFFKNAYIRKQRGSIQTTYAYWYDSQLFKQRPSHEKIKLFFWKFANHTKFLKE
jgi:hypothetical protein